VSLRLKSIDDDLSLFNDILILPGIEFEARPGVHLLVIFNNSVNLNIIETFLGDGGYKSEDIGKAEPLAQPNWDIIALLEESKKYDCIVIDAHTDSDKGIWNTIQGLGRVHCFRNPQLIGLCYLNEEQKDKIQNTLLNKPYNRSTPLAFFTIFRFTYI